MQETKEIRQKFLSYFAEKDHKISPSSPLVPHNDPTLMFTNAGMVQFKDSFIGSKISKFSRVATSQKCVRAGGKHNDLNNVGYTARHHTFFEMLGNFSFGDYFKEEAIYYAWELLTKEFGLPPEKLVATIYHSDDEAFNLWKKIAGLSDDKIIRIKTNDNFWTMGDAGPNGPCSEIFYDHGEEIEGGLPGTANENGDRFIEIWNLVFMQYNQTSAGNNPLLKPSIDTGMGLERMVAILQGKHNNYEIDLFQNLISAIKSESGAENIASCRIIADHLRSCCFLIADGVLPSNEGRGYVLRRIMRRAMRHAHILGAKQPLMHRLVPALITEMGENYPELIRADALIKSTLFSEEERFRETLVRGLRLLDDERSSIQDGVLSGAVAFKLYDTYGFPLDLTQDILRTDGLTVDEAGFTASMSEQKTRARAAWKGSGEAITSELWFDLREEFGATEFLGYSAQLAKNNPIKSNIIAIIKDGVRVDKASNCDAIIILNQTPFYGESGGQIGDIGFINDAEISNSSKVLGDLILHHATIKNELRIGTEITATINIENRTKIQVNHTATHLLHKALRNILGEHISQKGSAVDAGKLRFDFSNQGGLKFSQLREIENIVNAEIRKNVKVETCLMTSDAAIKSGAIALFGEKYGDEVRVVTAGFSTELCGGTHVNATGDIGLFKIVNEGAVASGVRRIEAITGDISLQYIANKEQILNDISAELKSSEDKIKEKILQIMVDKKSLEKEVIALRKNAALANLKIEKINGNKFIGSYFPDMPSLDLRILAQELLKKADIIVLISGANNKASMVIANNITNIDASDLIKKTVPIIGGNGGGGKPNFAQGGGNNPSKYVEAIAFIRAIINSPL